MPKKILLADDSLTIQKVVELTFSVEEYDVTVVGDGAQAIERIAADPPDLVLADVMMPKKTGYEVCEFVKGNPATRHVPVLLLVGKFEPFDQERASRAGAEGHILKPFESNVLVRSVTELLARQAAAAPAPIAVAVAPPPPAPPAPPPPAPAPIEEPPAAGLDPLASDFGWAGSQPSGRGSDTAQFGRPTAMDEPAPFAEPTETPAPFGAAAAEAPFGGPEPFGEAAPFDEPGAAEPAPFGSHGAAEAAPFGEPAPFEEPAVAAPAPLAEAATAPPAAADALGRDAGAATMPRPLPEEPRLDTRSMGGAAAAAPLAAAPTAAATAPSAAEGGPGISLDDFPRDVLEAIVEKVVRRMSDDVIREVAWQVVPELAELLVKKRIEELG